MTGSCTNALYFADDDMLGSERWQIDGLPNLWLRGRPPVDDPYTICLGGGATFGRHVERTYAAQLGAVNLGIGDASPATFRDPRLLAVIDRAEQVILQIPTARNESTIAWKQSTNVDGLPCQLVEIETFPTTSDRAWQFMLDSDRLPEIVASARESWVRQMRLLIAEIAPPVTLLWLSCRRPSETVIPPRRRPRTLHQLYNRYPQLITPAMLAEIVPLADRYVESIWRQQSGEYYPTQSAHNLAAELLGDCYRPHVPQVQRLPRAIFQP